MHFMLQKEVVERAAAGPGSKVYGRLSVMLQAFCDVTSLSTVGPGAFRPPPKVDSPVMRPVPRDPELHGIDERQRFADVCRTSFDQRRKTLRHELPNGRDEGAQRAGTRRGGKEGRRRWRYGGA